jgi:AcrR family transcriptional regulator
VLTQADVADFRERLCDAAARLFAARGQDGFTMRELASELGVSAMTPYRYFRDKEEILAAVRARAFARFADALDATITAPGPASTKALSTGQAYIKFAFGEPFSYRLMFDLSQPDEDHYPELVEATTRARSSMTGYVRFLIAEGLLEGDPELLSYVLWSALHGAVVLQLAGKMRSSYSFDTISAEIFRAMFEGFRPKVARASAAA